VLSGGISRDALEKAGARGVFDNARELCDHLDSTTVGALAREMRVSQP
jgi:hypothetical protein